MSIDRRMVAAVVAGGVFGLAVTEALVTLLDASRPVAVVVAIVACMGFGAAVAMTDPR